MAKLNSSGYSKRWSLDRTDVSIEILEDLGVSALEDDSGSNSSFQEEVSVLKPAPAPVSVPTKRKECGSPASFLPMEFSEDSQSNDSFLLSKRMRMDGPLGHGDIFSRLPDELVLCIFKWLPKPTIARCAQVSKRWRRLAYDEALWRRLDLSGTCLKPTVLGTVLLRGTQILRLAKTEVSHLS